ncbi:MAG: acyl-CoA thioesterase II [Sphingomonadaceae bacterium]|nr:acyl-CoA thioesterase II [Sphingomonadaceae bacterium]
MTAPERDERSPEELVAGLTVLLEVEELDTNLYRGRRLPGGVGRVFGGQVIAQALAAANQTVDAELFAHSLHAYFMRPGDENHPIIFRIERDRDGRSFSTRRIIALQKGQPILNMAANFQRPEEGLAHQFDMPDAPSPEDLVSERDFWRGRSTELPEKMIRWVTRARPIELRRVDPRGLESEKRPPFDATWFRAVAPLGDDIRLHQAVLAYASDMTLLGTAILPHGVNWLAHPIQTASLDHAVWFHEEFRADEWLLYTTDSPWSGHARGFNRGMIFARDGRLVASAAQEGLIRLRAERG